MALRDEDFRNDEERESYQLGETYAKMVKTEGWKHFRNHIESTVKNKKIELETCKMDEIMHKRGEIGSLQDLLLIVDNNVSACLEIEAEIKNITREDEDVS